jgi:DNA-binding GntR family transcriptional regulator
MEHFLPIPGVFVISPDSIMNVALRNAAFMSPCWILYIMYNVQTHDRRKAFGMLETLESVQRKPLKEEIFDILHNRIIAGKAAPGEWLRQEDISSQLGVSQTPVREALDLLVSAGLAERVPYRGVRVLQLNADEIADAYGMRLLLESTAAHAAATRRSPEQLEALRVTLEKTRLLVALSDMSMQRQLNREFHQMLVEASGNPLLARLYAMVANQFPDWMLYEYMFRHPELLEASLGQEYREHLAIVEAIAAGQGELAARHIREHIHNLGQELVTFLDVPEEMLHGRETQLGSLFA